MTQHSIVFIPTTYYIRDHQSPLEGPRASLSSFGPDSLAFCLRCGNQVIAGGLAPLLSSSPATFSSWAATFGFCIIFQRLSIWAYLKNNTCIPIHFTPWKQISFLSFYRDHIITVVQMFKTLKNLSHNHHFATDSKSVPMLLSNISEHTIHMFFATQQSTSNEKQTLS
jgi:hypothetical protein